MLRIGKVCKWRWWGLVLPVLNLRVLLLLQCHLFQNIPGGTEESHENFAGLRAKNGTEYTPATKWVYVHCATTFGTCS
jgi:hypothetical protein